MFQQAQQSNVMWTWIFRLGGFILMLVGVALILRPLSVLADVIPFVGSIVGAGTGILSFLIAAPFAFLTVAVAWLRYRPVIGISLLFLAAVAAGLILVLSKRGKSTNVSSPAGAKSTKTKDYKGIVSENMAQASSAHSTPPSSDGIAAANIEKVPQTAKVEPNPINVVDSLKKGQNYFRTGQYDQAVMQFSRVIKSGGNRKVAIYNRGVALFKLNKKEAALKDFKYAAKLGHEKAKAILNQIT
jgi:tetratricopeptide (TPR) repeat protein